MNKDKLRQLFIFLATDESMEAYAGTEEGKQLIISAVPEAETMFGYEQNSPWHEYELWTHTAKVVDGIDKRLNKELYEKLRIAAFFHDIGKPDTAMPKKTTDGSKHYSFPGHADQSALIAEPYLREMLQDPADVEEIMFYIAAHDLFLNLRDDEKEAKRLQINAVNIKRLMKRMKELYPEMPCRPLDFFRMMYLSQSDAAAHKRIVYEPDGTVKDTRRDMIHRTRMIRTIIKEELM